jgi:hypothetical protein
MLKIVDGTYISQIWFLHGDDADFDVLGSVWKTPTGWEAAYRFRYHDGDQSKDAFEDGDTKRGYTAVIPDATEEQVLATLNRVFRELAERAELTLEVVPVRTDRAEKVMAILSQQPWAHIRQVPA